MSTTSSSNYTTLYSANTSPIVPSTPYGNANVVSLLAVGSDGANTITDISATGNIYAENIFANVVGNLTVPGNTGEIVFNSSGSACTSPGLTFVSAGNILSVTGNVSGTYFLGNGSQLTGLPATYGNANVSNFLANYGSNVVSTTGNVTAGYMIGDGSLITNLPAGNYSNSNVVSLMAAFGSNTIVTTGNITGGYILGNGSQLTGLPATYGNANVVANLAALGSNPVSTTGNITAGYFVGNGSALTGITSDYGNSNVATFLASGTNTQDIITTGTVTGNLLTTAGASGNIIGVNYVSANYYVGNGSLLTGLAATYSNANVASFLAAFGSNSIVTTGNITAGTISATGNVYVGGSLNSDDITSSNITVYGDQVITGNLTVQGNTTTINSNVVTTNDKTITVANNQSTGANVNGAGLEVGNTAVATWLYADASQSWQSNIGITPTSNAVLDLGTNSLRWNTVYANVANITGNVSANYYTGNGSLLTGVVATSVGTLSTLSVTGTATVGNVVTGGEVSATGNVTGAYIVGNGSLLNNITGANVTGTVANAAYATSAGSATTAVTVTGNAQANITSVGVLTGLSVTGTTQSGNLLTAGEVSATGNVTGNYILGNGSQLTGLPATYGNANVADFLANGFGSNTVSTTGNVSTGNIIVPTNSRFRGDFSSGPTAGRSFFQTTSTSTTAPSFMSVIPGPNHNGVGVGGVNGMFSSADVGNSSIIGMYSYDTESRIQATKFGTANALPMTFVVGTPASEAMRILTTGNVGVGNTAPVDKFSVEGNAYVSGNVTGAYFIGNGSALTGITSTYSDSNVATFLAAFGSNVVSTTGTITGGNITGGNILTVGVVSATGNVSGNYFIGNGSQLTGISAGSSGDQFNPFLLSGM